VEFVEQANRAFRRGETDYAVRIAEVALELAQKAQDAGREVDALCMLARTALRNGDIHRVAEIATEARTKATGDPRLEKMAIHTEAVAARMQGNLATARDLYRASLELCESLGDDVTAASEYRNLAYVEFHAGNRERARRLFLEARRRFERLGDDQFFPYIVADAALLALEDGDAAKSATLVGAADGAFEAAGDIPDSEDVIEQSRTRQRARDVLGEQAFALWFEVGTKLPIVDALQRM
jgi:tetratricopeptide (TPR) repeat protein